MPSKAILKYIGRRDLESAIAKRGGIRKFSKLLNIPSTNYYMARDGDYLQSGYECIFDNILFKYGIPHQVHQKIDKMQNYRSDFLIYGTHVEICGYERKEHPDYFKRLALKLALYEEKQIPYLMIPKSAFAFGIHQVEQNIVTLLREIHVIPKEFPDKEINPSDIKPMTYWADLNNIKNELLPMVRKYGRMPLDHEFRKERKAALVGGIYKYYKSPFELSKLLGINCLYKPKGFYNEENSVNEYKALCEKYNKFLSLQELQELKAFGVAGYISKNGGFHVIRAKTELAFPKRRVPNKYYNLKNAAEEYRALCIEKCKFLSSKSLAKEGARALATFITKNGGYYLIRNITGLDFPNPASKYKKT